MVIPAPFYNRAPSAQFLELLSPGGFLSPLIGLAAREIDGYRHDVHFREHNELHAYRGRTSLVAAKLLYGPELRLTADRSYQAQPCGKNFLRR